MSDKTDCTADYCTDHEPCGSCVIEEYAARRLDAAHRRLAGRWIEYRTAYVYRDDATRQWYRAGREDLLELGRALLGADADGCAYSRWCADTDAEPCTETGEPLNP